MKIQLFILSLCGVTFAQHVRNSESETKGGHYYRSGHRHENNIAVQSEDETIIGNTGRHTNGIPNEGHNREWYERHETPMRRENGNGEVEIDDLNHNREWHERHGIPQRNGNGGNDRGGERNSFTHNREWHERHGIPMPPGNGRNVGEPCQHFIHSREWHERHGIGMPENSHPCATSTTIRPTTRPTAIPTARPTAIPTARPTTRSTARPTFRQPESSEEISPRRENDEYDESQWNQMP